MAYDESGGAAAALKNPAPDAGGDAAVPDKKPDAGEGNLFIPAFPGSENLKPGDPLPLRMVGQTAEGEIECEPMPMGDGGEPEWKKDLKGSVQTIPGGAGMGMTPEM